MLSNVSVIEPADVKSPQTSDLKAYSPDQSKKYRLEKLISKYNTCVMKIFLEVEWKPNAVRALIELHRENKESFKDPCSKNTIIWEEIVRQITDRFPGF